MYLEQFLLAGCSVVWVLVILANFGLVPLAGTLDLDLYRLYSLAAVIGWVAGNIYVFRSQTNPRARSRKRLFLNYLMGPLSFVYILRAFAHQSVQEAAPFVPVYSLVVYILFFLVPVTLRATRKRRRDIRDP